MSVHYVQVKTEFPCRVVLLIKGTVIPLATFCHVPFLSSVLGALYNQGLTFTEHQFVSAKCDIHTLLSHEFLTLPHKAAATVLLLIQEEMKLRKGK